MYYYKLSLLGGLIVCLGHRLIFTLWLLSALWSLFILQSSGCWTFFLAIYGFKCTCFFLYMTLSLVLMRYDLFSGNCWITVAGYHLLSLGSLYMTFWPMGILCVGVDNDLSFTWRISAVGLGAWLIPIFTLAACDNGRSVRACLPCKICISDCKVLLRAVFL